MRVQGHVELCAWRFLHIRAILGIKTAREGDEHAVVRGIIRLVRHSIPSHLLPESSPASQNSSYQLSTWPNSPLFSSLLQAS